MDWFSKFVITAGAALLILHVAQRFGQRMAGVVAALPLVTAPALVWVAHDHGIAFAVGAAVGSVAACAMLAFFALAFSVVAARHGSAIALLAGSAAAAPMALPVLMASGSLLLSLLLACLCIVVVLASLPAVTGLRVDRRVSHRRMAVAAVTVGASTAALAAMGPWLGHVATGLLSSLPLIGATAAVLEHARGGHAASTEFLRGYVIGLFSKAVFGAVFAVVAPQAGAPFALGVACVTIAALSLLSGAGRGGERRELVEA